MSKFYYVAKDNLKDLKIITDKDSVLCLTQEPFRNWIVGFDVFQKPIDNSTEVTLDAEFEVLKVPEGVLDIEIISSQEELGNTIKEIILDTLTNMLDITDCN